MNSELLIYSHFGEYTAERFIQSCEELKDDDITIRVNSGGGSVFHGWGMIAKMREHKKKIHVKVDGFAASMACNFILFATSVEALSVSRFMLHRADMYTDNEEQKKLLADVNADLRKALEAKVDPEEFKKVTGKTIAELFDPEQRIDVWLSAKQAKKLGLVDKVVEIGTKEAEAYSGKIYDIAASYDPAGQKPSADTPADDISLPISDEIPAPPASKPTSKSNSETMTSPQLREKHPELYRELYAGAVKAERERVEAWLPFLEVDAELAKKGIESGSAPRPKDFTALTIKSISKETLDKLGKDSPDDVSLPEGSKPGDDKEAQELRAFEEKIDAELGIKKSKTE